MKKQNKYHPLSGGEKKLFKQQEGWEYSIEKLFIKTGIRLFESFSLFKEYNELSDYVVLQGKGSKDRKIPLTKDTKQLLEIWREKIKWSHMTYQDLLLDAKMRELQAKARALMKNGWDGQNYLKNITDEMKVSARRLDAFRKQVSRSFKLSRLLKQHGKFNPHRFRATFATSLIDNGVDIVTIQTLMGHASIKQTAEYIKVSDLKLRNAIETLEPNNSIEGMTREELYQEVLRLRMRLRRESEK